MVRRLILVLLLAACSGGNYGAPVQHSAGQWSWWGSSTFLGPTQCADLLCFTFPTGNSALNHVDYMLRQSGSLASKNELTAHFTISGQPTFQATQPGTCDPTPKAHLFFAVQGYGVSGSTGENIQRWWSNPISVKLTGGDTTLTVPLTPDQWSDVDGQSGESNLSAFADAMDHAGWIGLTFGGGCSFGHGVNTAEPGVTFTLHSLEAQ